MQKHKLDDLPLRMRFVLKPEADSSFTMQECHDALNKKLQLSMQAEFLKICPARAGDEGPIRRK